MPFYDITATIIEDKSVLTSETPLNEYQVIIHEENFTIIPNLIGAEFTQIVYATHSFTSDYATTAGSASYASTASYLLGSIESSSYAVSSSFAMNAISSSYALSGSFSRTSLSASYSQNAQNYSSSFSTRITTDETNISSLQTASGSFSTRVTGLESFSSSLDLTYATDAQLAAATASLSSSLAVDIAQNSSDISNLQTASGSFSTRVTTLENKTSYSGSFSGSFQGDGAGITGIISSSYAVSASYAANVPATSSYALYAQNALSSSYAVSSSYASNVPLTASYALSSSQAISSSYAASASYVKNAASASYYGGTVVSSSYAITASYIAISNLPIYWEHNDYLYNKQGFSGSIQLRPTNLQTNFLIGGTAIGDYYSSRVPARVVDGNYADLSGVTGNYWTADVGTLPKSWEYDLGAGITKTMTKFRIIPLPNATGSGNHYAKNFTVSGSQDGTNWTLLGTYEIPPTVGDGGWHTFTSSNATAYRYYQFGFQDNYKASGTLGFEDISIVEIEMYEPYTQGIVGITGSLVVASGITGSLFGTSSWANNSVTSSYSLNAISASYAVSASYEITKEVSSSHADTADTASYVENAQSASYVLSASYAPSIPSGTYSFDNLDNIPAGIVSGAEQINTGSFSGSFYGDGSNLNDIQLASTASYFQTSSITPSASFAEFAQTASFVVTALTASYFATSSITPSASYVNTAETASYVLTAETASYFQTGSITPSASYVQLAESASYVNTAETASYYGGSVESASYALSSSFALSASYSPGGSNYWTAVGNTIFNNVTESIRLITHPSESHAVTDPTFATIDPLEYANYSASNAAYTSSLPITPGGFIGSGSTVLTGSICTVSASNTRDTDPTWGPINAVDGKYSTTAGTSHANSGTNTRWATNAAPPWPVIYLIDFGSGNNKTVNKFAHMPVTVNGAGTWAKYFSISGSLDNITYTPLIASAAYNITNQDYANVWMTYEWANSTAYRYYKINYSASHDTSNNILSINEMQMFFFTSSVDSGSLMAQSEGTLKTSGSYSLKATADKNALNGTLTHTLTSSLNLSGYTNIQFDARSNRTGENFELHMHDTGGSINSHSINIATSGSWQHETWDIGAITNTNKDAIDYILVKITNADADNIIHLDGIWAYNSGSDVMTIHQGKIEVSGSLYLSSPDASIWKLTITNAGVVSASKEI